VINGGVALSNGEPTGKATGRVVRGQGWKGWPDGGCRASAKGMARAFPTMTVG
jgi:N-acyl-D-amino-acid deacylase